MRLRPVRLRPIHLLRYGLPGSGLIAGIVLMVVGGTRHTIVSAIGLTAVCIAVIVWLTNIFVRMSLVSQKDREREALAREMYSRTGSWTDPQSLAAEGPAPVPARHPAPSPGRAPEPERAETPSPAPQRPSRPYSAPERIRSRAGGAGSARGRRRG